jgi:hypothetical protein
MQARHALVPALVALVAMGPCARASAQATTATLVMTADRTEVAAGDTFRLQIRCDVVNAPGAPDPSLPDLSAFEVVSRQISRPMTFSMGWGGQQQVMQATAIYTFLLRPTRQGRIALRPARLELGRQTYQSNPLTITVGPPGAGAPPPPTSVGPPMPPSTGLPMPPTPVPIGGGPTPPTPAAIDPSRGADAYVYDDRAFLRTVVDVREPYVGQQITITTYLYVRGPLSQWPGTTQESTTDGFWVRDLLPPTRSPDPTVQQVHGVMFHAYVMRRVAAFPLHEGDLTIGPMSLTIPQGTPFDILMGQVTPDLARTGQPVVIHARALPEAGRPSGPVHVGTLTLAATLDRTQAPTGDALTLTVRATGTGQIDGLQIGELHADGLRVLAPQIETSIETPGDRVGGTRTYEWLVVPERPGTLTIPAFRVATFDPVSGTYGAATTAPLEIQAAGNALTDPTPAPSEPTAPDASADDEGALQQLGPVRTQAELVRHRTHLVEQPWYPWALGAFPAGWLLLVIGTRLRRRAAARGAEVTPAKIAREAKKRLATAEERAKAGDARGFYGALSLAISAVIEGKLGESVGALTNRELGRRLRDRGMSDALARKVCAELEGAEFARYSTSGAAPAEMDAALARGRELLTELDRFVATEEDA